jgi:hypothetical protein
VFYLEHLQTDWSANGRQAVIVEVLAVSGTLLAWLTGGIKFLPGIGGALVVWLGLSATGALGVGLFASPVEIRSPYVSTLLGAPLRFDALAGFRRISWDRVGIAAGTSAVMAGLAVGVLVGLLGSRKSGIIAALIAAIFVALLTLLTSLLSVLNIEAQRNPNHGMLSSGITALTTAAIVLITIGGILWLSTGKFGLSLSIALYTGGHSVRHIAVRLVLTLRRRAPIRYVRFLDYGVVLMEYFAALALNN